MSPRKIKITIFIKIKILQEIEKPEKHTVLISLNSFLNKDSMKWIKMEGMILDFDSIFSMINKRKNSIIILLI